MKELYFLKLNRDLVEEIICGEIDYLYKNFHPIFSNVSFYSFSSMIGSNSSDFCVQYFCAEDKGNSEFTIEPYRNWVDKDFITKCFQNMLDINGIKDDFDYLKIGNEKVKKILGQHILETKINKHVRKKMKIVKLEFLGCLKDDFRCIVVLSNKKNIQHQSIEDIDKKIDFCKGNYDSIITNTILHSY